MKQFQQFIETCPSIPANTVYKAKIKSAVAGAPSINSTVSSNIILFFSESPRVEWANPETDFLAHKDITSSGSLVSLSCVSESANFIYALCVLSEPVLESPEQVKTQNGCQPENSETVSHVAPMDCFSASLPGHW